MEDEPYEPYPWEATHIVAAAAGDVATLQQELDKGVDLNDTDHEYSQTSLFWAAEKGHEDAVQLLIRYGADVNFIDPNLGRTPLLAATADGHEAVARHLIEAGARLNIKDANSETPLIMAAKDGRLSLVKLLLNAGADIDAKGWHYGMTALSLAAAKGHTDIVEFLLQNNAATDHVDETGRKALAWAVEEGYDDIVKLLANRGADTGSAGAAKEELTSETLFSAYIGVSSGSDEDRLGWAFERGHISVVKEILEQATDLEHRDETGRTPLVLAASEGYIELVKLLLGKGVDVDSKDEEGRTPLSYAAENGHMEVVTLLLDNGADIHSEDDQEMTPLTAGALRGHEDIVSLLLQKGADPNHWDGNGVSPLLHAAFEGHTGIVSMLLERGVDPNTRDREEGKSALTWAASDGHLEVLKLLLERNVSPNDEETDQTPLALALDNAIDTDDFSAVKLLLEHGAQPFSEVYWDNIPPLEVAVSNGLDELVELFLKVEPASSKAKQEHVRKAICKAVEAEREDLLALLFEHYAPEDPDAETPLQWAEGKCCGSKEAVRLLKPYFPDEAGHADS
ncbi:hypothetical protein CEP54_004081 [Fusarium duplospermum]|uniref:Uncharacterized protein n=1 Tax=Fusarium duplospermum TaxID=1325734 RepID=A0A428QKS0_9HYPO|nr:hypothetical protein CEP54_004081 [Fusarium duplospermum]